MSHFVRKKNLVMNCLLEGSTVEQTSQKTGITTRTIFRWLNDTGFKTEFTRRQSEIMNAYTLRLVALGNKAFNALEKVLETPTLPGAGNLRLAGSTILDLILKWKDAVDFEERISALERKVNNETKGH